MFGAWEHLWAGNYLKVARLDPEARRVATAQASSYGFREGNPFYFLNVLEELDQPGEWYLDRASGLLYVLPPADLSKARVDFPLLSAPFVAMQDVRNVTLRGLTFEVGRAEGAVITGGEQVLLAGCTFQQLGANGVVIRGGTGHGVLGCDIRSVGAGGVRVAGGDRKTLTPGNHFVENCHISDFSRVDRVYAPAVHVDGVGQRIAHNLFHDSPHHGMRVEGYEHTIEFNEIHSVVYEFDDQAGIDIYGNPAYRGLVLRNNFWHHIGSGYNVAGQAGIRLDDFISDVLIYGNVFYRCAGGKFGGVQIHGGKDNIVDNNLFIDCKYAISFSPWGQARWLERLAADGTKWAIGPRRRGHHPAAAQRTVSRLGPNDGKRGPQFPVAECRGQLRRIHHARSRREPADGQPRLPGRRGLCRRRPPRLHALRHVARLRPLRLPPHPVPRDRPVPGRIPGNLARPARSHAAVCAGRWVGRNKSAQFRHFDLQGNRENLCRNCEDLFRPTFSTIERDGESDRDVPVLGFLREQRKKHPRDRQFPFGCRVCRIVRRHRGLRDQGTICKFRSRGPISPEEHAASGEDQE